MKIHSLSLALLGALSMCLSGCSNDDTPTGGAQDKSEGLTACLTVTAKGIPTFAQSRWDDGNNRPSQEPSVNNEGVIHDVLLFIYDGAIGSADSSAKPLQVEHLTVSQSGTHTNGEKKYVTPAFALDTEKVNLSGSGTSHTYYVFVVANPDASLLGDSFVKNATLQQIRDWEYTGPIFTASASGTTQPTNVGDVSGFDRFVMSSDQECTMVLTKSVVDNKGTVNINNGEPILVERLAARIDISFGKSLTYNGKGEIATEGTLYLDSSDNMVTFSGGTPGTAVNSIELPVYDYTQYKAGSLVRLPDTYVISGVGVSNIVGNAQKLIQYSDGTYFKGEAWVHKGTGDNTQEYNGKQVRWEGWYCDKLIAAAASYSYASDELHLLSGLITANNNLYTNAAGQPFYTLGYYRENVKNNNGATTYAAATEGRTKVTVAGVYNKARDLDQPAQTISQNLEFVISHCHLVNGGVVPNYDRSMAYAVGRNTIYRICIDKILADTEHVYVIWYYDYKKTEGSDVTNDGKFEPYENSTPFSPYIVGKNDAPND